MTDPIATPTLLVVDDTAVDLALLQAMLEDSYRVVTAGSGPAALALLADGLCPDLIVLDVMMPDMDGYEVLDRLRAIPAARDIPVVLVTASDPMDEERGLNSGAVDFLTKPIRQAVVLARIRTQLNMKAAQDQLRNQNLRLAGRVAQRESVLNTIASAAQDAIVMIDGGGRISFWNPAAERIFNYRTEEVVGRPLRALLASPGEDDTAASSLGHIAFGQSGGMPGTTVELTALRKDGSAFPVEASLAAVRRGGDWWGVGILRDISERKAIEAQIQAQLAELMRANAELKELNDKVSDAQGKLVQSEKMASLGVLAAGVAHEINNPVGYVSSNLATLKQYVTDLLRVLESYEAVRAAAPVPAPFHDVAKLVAEVELDYMKGDVLALIGESQEGIDRVRKIVQDLKDFSRAESRETWADADLRHAIESTLNVVWNELKYKCEVRKEFAPLPRVECLVSQINQVFMNMLVNAAQAIETRGVITLRSGVRDAEIWIEITDTGKGMTPEVVSRIFDPFFTTKPVGKGTGLGLAVSYNIVEKHHGRIEVESAPGAGTTFRVWLPVRQPHGEA
ncbi:MAG: PAS domain S-box protein [Gammaproteobacteria bacterium]|nr:PAS domain S-box protein [Gammaproteobacteria bacterium]